MKRALLALTVVAVLSLLVVLRLGTGGQDVRAITPLDEARTSIGAGADGESLQSATSSSAERAIASGPDIASGSGASGPDVAADTGLDSDDLLVRVVDPVGAPVAGVALRLRADARVAPAPTAPPQLTTDADGRARFTHVRSSLALLARASDGMPWMLTHEIPFENPPSITLDATKLAEPVVVSVVPFHGAIEIHVRCVDGTNALDGSRVQLLLLGEEDLASALPPRSTRDWSADTHGGSALFPCVELGRTWDVLVSAPGSQVRTHVRAKGPIGARARESIDVVLGADHPVIAYRAVDKQRKPLPNVEVEVTRDHVLSFGFNEKSRRRTDRDARFLVEVENGRGMNREQLLVSCRPSENVDLFARAAIPSSLVNGLNEGGDVVLLPPPLLAEGVVKDGAGERAAGAVVYLNAGQHPRMTFGDQQEASDASVECDAQGHFEFRGMFTASQLDLWATKAGSRSPKTRVDQGARDVVLTLSKFFTLSGRLLLDPGVDANRASIQLTDPKHREVSCRVQKWSDGGRFTTTPVPSGTYDITWSFADVRIAERLQVDVSHDVDLGEIDARGRFHDTEIVLVGVPDASKLRGGIAWRASGSQDKWNDRGFERSPIHIVTAASPIDVWVRADGYRSDIAYGVVGTREIQLTAPLRVRLSLNTTGPIPKAPYTFDIALDQDGVSVGQHAGPQTFTDENRELVYSVAAPGRVRVRWHLEWRRDSGAIGCNVLQDQETEIEVRDVPEEQLFRIDLDGKALTRLATNPPF
jgi:hypothetical protein